MTPGKIALALVLLAGSVVLSPAPSLADGNPGNRGGNGAHVVARKLRLSLRIAESGNKVSAGQYYRSLARRQRWRSIRLPIPYR